MPPKDRNMFPNRPKFEETQLCKVCHFDSQAVLELTEEEVRGAQKVINVLKDWDEDIWFSIVPKHKLDEIDEEIETIELRLKALKERKQEIINEA